MTETAMDPEDTSAVDRVTPLEATLPEPSREVAPAEQATSAIATSPLDRLIAAATDPRVDVDKMERLLAIADRWRAQEAKVAFAGALADMQPDLPEVKRRGIADRYKYALWEDIQEALRPVLNRHGFSLSFKTDRPESGFVRVTAILLHRAGHSEQTEMVMPFDASGNKNPVQSIGSGIQYGKRYTAQALLNLTARGEDDDGQAAGNTANGTGEIIMPADADNLRELLDAIGRTESQFVHYLNEKERLRMKTLDDLPASALANVRKFLLAKKQATMQGDAA